MNVIQKPIVLEKTVIFTMDEDTIDHDYNIHIDVTTWVLRLHLFPPPWRKLNVVIIRLDNSEESDLFGQPIDAEFSFTCTSRTNDEEDVTYRGTFGICDENEVLIIPVNVTGEVIVKCKIRISPEKYEVIEPGEKIPPPSLSNGIAAYLLNEKFSDVTLTVNNQNIPAHRNILSSVSPVFASLLENNDETTNRTLEINDLSYEVVIQVLTFIYTAKTPLINDLSEEILIAANRYQLDQLKSRCEKVLLNKLDVANACNLLVSASLYNAEKLCVEVKSFIVSHFDAVKKTEGFSKMATTHLHLLMEILLNTDGLMATGSK